MRNILSFLLIALLLVLVGCGENTDATAQEQLNLKIAQLEEEISKLKETAKSYVEEIESLKKEKQEISQEMENLRQEYDHNNDNSAASKAPGEVETMTTTSSRKQEEIERIQKNLDENFKNLGYFEYHHAYKAFNFYSTDPNFKAAIEARVNGMLIEEWNNLMDSFKKMSQSIKDNVASGYTINILNPHNEEKALLTVQDGNVLYDAFGD